MNTLLIIDTITLLPRLEATKNRNDPTYFSQLFPIKCLLPLFEDENELLGCKALFTSII